MKIVRGMQVYNPSPAEYSGQYKQIPKKAAQTIDSRVAPFQKGPVAVSRSAQF